MPLASMPAIDAQACSGWTEQDTELYNKMPFYLAKMQVDRKKTYPIWSKYTKKRKWKPNMGSILRGVRSAPSPHMRQFAFPNRLCAMPKKDVVDIREVTAEAELYRHRFESPVFNFCPSFVDFLNHIDEHGKDIMEKMERFEDVYIRGNIFHQSPYMFVIKDNGLGDNSSSAELIYTTPWGGTGTFNSATDGKTTAVLTAANNKPTGTLTLEALNQIFTIMENDLRIPFFSGSDTPKEDSFLSGKYLVILSSEKYVQFTFDPWLLENKSCDYDIVNSSFKGSFFGRGTARLEDLPLRYTTEGVFHPPELRVDADSVAFDAGDTQANSNYSDLNVSPIEVGWVMGPSGYESLEVGPPPSQFTGDSFPNAPKMFWNGEVKLTKHILTPCVDSDTGEITYEANTYGEYIKFIAQAVYGIIAAQRRNVIPIVYLRHRGRGGPVAA